jgi:hypothetical protein
MKKFNLRMFMIATVVLVLLNFVSWAGLEAHNTPDRSHTLLGMVGSIWTVLRFPIFTLFWKFLYSQNNILLFSTAVSINCVFYAIIVERIYYFLRKKPKIPPIPTHI